MVYSLLSVPIALHYLSRAEFGLWALVTQLTSYISLVDLGMSGAIARILVDHKDDREETTYGSILQTGFLVGAAQGAILLAASGLCSFTVGRLVKVDPGLEPVFIQLLVLQSIPLALGFVFRPLSLLFTAHQRYDVSNNAQVALLLVSLAVLWIAFYLGTGIYSLVWAAFAGQIVYLVLAWQGCRRLGFFPQPGKWGKPTLPLFWELFVFAKDVFLMAVGNQLLNASQVILLTRMLGLEAGAIWSVGTRAFVLLSTAIFRLFDFSSGALAEMMVRGESDRLLARFRTVTIFSSSVAAYVAVMVAVCNGPFIEVWTSGRISWSPYNDILLGILLTAQVIMRSHTGLVGQTKKFEALRWLYFAEGAFFVAVSLFALPRWGVPGMLVASIAGISSFSLQHGFVRTARYFKKPLWEIVVRWSVPMFRVAAWLVPLAATTSFLFSGLPVRLKLIAVTLGTGLPGLLVLLRFGLEDELKRELIRRLPEKPGALIQRLIGGCRPIPLVQ